MNRTQWISSILYYIFYGHQWQDLEKYVCQKWILNLINMVLGVEGGAEDLKRFRGVSGSGI